MFRGRAFRNRGRRIRPEHVERPRVLLVGQWHITEGTGEYDDVWTLREDGCWHHPIHGRLRAISGGQDELGFSGVPDAASLGFGADPFNVGGFDTSGITERGAPSSPWSGGVGSFLTSAGQGAKDVLPLVQLGAGIGQIPLSIMSLLNANKQQGLLERAQKQAASTAAPAAAGAAQLIPAGVSAEMTGQLPPELETRVQGQVNELRTRLLNQLVSQGMDPQAARAQVEEQLKEYETTLRTQYGAALLQGGTNLTSAALGGTGQVAETALGQISGTAGALAAANKSLAALLGQQA
jgi:hypothetical protein